MRHDKEGYMTTIGRGDNTVAGRASQDAGEKETGDAQRPREGTAAGNRKTTGLQAKNLTTVPRAGGAPVVE